MINTPTVFILGAGASHAYGYPTGGTLRTLILQIARIVCSSKPLGSHTIHGIKLNVEIFIRCREFVEESIDHHRSFLECFEADPASGTIDRFLYDNHKFADVGRFYVMFVLLICQYRTQLNQGRNKIRALVEEPSGLHDKNALQDWYPSLVGKLRPGCDTPKELEGLNNLNILTFNYDVSIDLYLERNLAATERHQGANWEEAAHINHLYGSLPFHTQSQTQLLSFDLAEYAWEHKDRIRLIGDRDTSAMDAAKAKIQEAERIVFLGFGFDPDNLELLEIPDLLEAKHVTCHNYPGDKGMNRRIRTKFQEWRFPLHAFAREPSRAELTENINLLDPSRSTTILPYDKSDFFEGDITDDITAGLLGLD